MTDKKKSHRSKVIKTTTVLLFLIDSVGLSIVNEYNKKNFETNKNILGERKNQNSMTNSFTK